MRFKHGTRRRAAEYEREIAKFWRRENIFEKSIDQRPKDNSFVFYDGPPFLTGTPHYGHLMVSTIKDAVARYQTMKGKRVERGWGWDCHGLPAERFVEAKLGIANKKEIGTKISVADYVRECRAAMVKTGTQWEDTIERLGRWVDMTDAYRTMDAPYMESVWWAFKELYEKGKIYEGEKILVYCTKDATPISKSEVAMENSYQMDTDPSVYVYFKLDGRDEYLLAWTTTPWTLPANVALAVNPELEYSKLRLFNGSDKVYLISGKHAAASKDYFPKLKKQLESQGLDVTIIDHINPSAPDYEKNVKNLDKFDFTDANVITHSLGASTFLSWLERNDAKINSLTMIAPSYPGKSFNSTSPEWMEKSGYAGFKLDYENIQEKITQKPKIIYSDDNELKVSSFKDLGERLDAEMIFEAGKGHYFNAYNPENDKEPDYEFSFAKVVYIASDAVERVLTNEKHKPLNYKVIKKVKGSDLVGLGYEPLFANRGPAAHHVLAADFVTDTDGTGIVHEAPAYGEEDYELAKANGVPIVSIVDENGDYTEGPWQGQNIWAVNKEIAKTLFEQGKALKIEYIRHEYPHCHRCGEKLMYRAHPSWFMDIDGQRAEMLAENAKTKWMPPHIGEKRFHNIIEVAPDWNLSRDRYWATPIPVWKGARNDGTTVVKVIGSYDELEKLSGVRHDDYHLPNVMDIEFECEGVTMRHIGKVLDCWFESGSMPFAQFHYPFENKEKFEANFPADFITESMDQTRGWFYSLMAVNVGLFGQAPFKNLICSGLINASDGKKMSKKLQNYTEPDELFDKYSVDSFRFTMLSSPVAAGDDFSLRDKDVSDVARKLAMIWNMYDFFTMYAEVDKWEWNGGYPKLEDLKNPLDIWIVSRAHKLTAQITKFMDEYNLPDAMSAILPFVDDASNWYVRRSRRRFWKSEDDVDKNDAYGTLHYVLTTLAKLLAPFTPFLAEELYQKLTGGESVHLLDWPTEAAVDDKTLADMTRTRKLIESGLAIRMRKDETRGEKTVKIRQPLAHAAYAGQKLDDFYEQVMAEELNVKEIRHIVDLPSHLADYDVVEGEIREEAWVEISKKITPELKREGMAREVIRHVQSARKEARLNVDDRITVSLTTQDEELRQAIDEHYETIAAETLATKSVEEIDNGFKTTVQVDGAELKITLSKQ